MVSQPKCPVLSIWVATIIMSCNSLIGVVLLCMQQASIAEDDVAAASLARLDALQHESLQVSGDMNTRLMLQLSSTEQQQEDIQASLTKHQVALADFGF